MIRALAFLLSIWLPLCGQSPLRIRVVEGEGFVYATDSRATQGVIVEITDEAGDPAAGATVRFELPRSGPSGEFSSGSRTMSVTTGADGRAEAWGMRWNGEPGPLELRVTASRGASTGTAQIGLSLRRAAAPAPAGQNPGRSRKKFWITLALAGAAGVAVAGLAGRTPAQAGAAPVNPPVIGTPTITISRP